MTYVADKSLRLSSEDSGYYINIFPWIPWQRGEKIPVRDVREGRRGRKLTAKQLKLAEEQKPAGSLELIKFDRLLKQHDNRIALLKKLRLDIESSIDPQM